MTRLKFILLFCLSMLFLGILVSDSSEILLNYQNRETNGFIDGDAYYIEAYDTEKVFSTYEELIALAKSKSDSFIILAKLNNNKTGVYTYNYDWNIPLSSGRVFNDKEMNSKELFVIDPNTPDRIGTSFKDTYVNLHSIPLTFENGFSNVTIISNIPLSSYARANVRNIIDSLFEQKRFIFTILYYGMILLIFIISYQMNKSELIIRKLLGHSQIKVAKDFFLKMFTFFFISYLIALILFFLVTPQMFFYRHTVISLIRIIIMRFVIIEIINFILSVVLMCCYQFIPVQRLKELNAYDD